MYKTGQAWLRNFAQSVEGEYPFFGFIWPQQALCSLGLDILIESEAMPVRMKNCDIESGVEKKRAATPVAALDSRRLIQAFLAQ